MPAQSLIYLAREWSPLPAGRNINENEYNGQDFRTKFLEPSLKEFDVVTVDIEGVIHMTSSFMEEAFAGLVRERVIEPGEFERRVKIVAESNGFFAFEIKKYVSEAETHIRSL